MLLQLVQVSISSILILKKMNQYKQQRGQDVTVVTTQQGSLLLQPHIHLPIVSKILANFRQTCNEMAHYENKENHEQE